MDVPIDEDPQATPAQQALHTQYGRAGRRLAAVAPTARPGQTGYPNRLVTDRALPAETNAGPGFIGGGSHVVVDPDTPGLAGGTFKSRQLGIDSLEDVP